MTHLPGWRHLVRHPRGWGWSQASWEDFWEPNTTASALHTDRDGCLSSGVVSWQKILKLLDLECDCLNPSESLLSGLLGYLLITSFHSPYKTIWNHVMCTPGMHVNFSCSEYKMMTASDVYWAFFISLNFYSNTDKRDSFIFLPGGRFCSQISERHLSINTVPNATGGDDKNHEAWCFFFWG